MSDGLPQSRSPFSGSHTAFHEMDADRQGIAQPESSPVCVNWDAAAYGRHGLARSGSAFSGYHADLAKTTVQHSRVGV
jgi:hypothetical protein